MNDHIPNTKALSMRTGSPLLSIMPTSLDEVARMAKLAIMAGLVIAPKKKYGEDDDQQATDADKTTAIATMIILHGLEVGLPPMQALQTIALVNGRPLIYGDAVPALLWRAGFKIDETINGEGEQKTARCVITRPDGTKVQRSFSVADALKANLLDRRQTVKRWVKDWNNPNGKKVQKDVDNDAPWFRFEDRMLAMRARGFAVKDGASDVTRGLYLREEYDEPESIVDITPPTVNALDIPDPPAVAAPVDEIPDPPAQDVSEQRFLDMLTAKYSQCDSEQDVNALKDEYGPAIDDLSPENKAAALAILVVP